MDMKIKVKCNWLGAIILSTLDLRILLLYTRLNWAKTPAACATIMSIYLIIAGGNTSNVTQQSSSRWDRKQKTQWFVIWQSTLQPSLERDVECWIRSRYLWCVLLYVVCCPSQKRHVEVEQSYLSEQYYELDKLQVFYQTQRSKLATNPYRLFSHGRWTNIP